MGAELRLPGAIETQQAVQAVGMLHPVNVFHAPVHVMGVIAKNIFLKYAGHRYFKVPAHKPAKAVLPNAVNGLVGRCIVALYVIIHRRQHPAAIGCFNAVFTAFAF